VSDEEDRCIFCHTQCAPTDFALNDAILFKEGVRVIEDEHCIFESDAVLAFVACCLRLIPPKQLHLSAFTVTTNS
jgi:hypothetical protein